jgi:hypothetical protein
VIVAGNVNVATTDNDAFHPDAFVGLTHITPAERAAWNGMLGAGLVDVDVARWGPRARHFTLWNYRIGIPETLKCGSTSSPPTPHSPTPSTRHGSIMSNETPSDPPTTPS